MRSIFLGLVVLASSTVAFSQSPREEAAQLATKSWIACVRVQFDQLKASKEDPELIAEAAFSGCEELEANARSKWLPLYYPVGNFSLSTSSKIATAEADTEEATARMRRGMRASMISELIKLRLK